MIERFFLTLKQEWFWMYRFENRDHAFTIIRDRLERCDRERHTRLSSLTPRTNSGNA